MSISSSSPIKNQVKDQIPKLKAEAAKFGRDKTRLRLIITIPILMMTFPLVSGVLQYHFIINKVDLITNPQANMLVQESLISIWFVTAALILVAVFCGLLLAHYITQPIQKLTTTLKDFSAGNFMHEIDFNAQDELADLGNSFNHMVQALNNTIEERNRIILECYTGGLITLNQSGQVTAVNTSAENILQTDSHFLMGKLFPSYLKKLTGSDTFTEIVNAGLFQNNFVHSVETSISRNDGTAFPLIVTTSALRGKDDVQQGLIINFRDLTKYKQFYKRLNRTDRLATAGTLAMGVAHEIRNPLASIRGMAQLLRDDLDRNDSTEQYIEVIIEESHRLDQVVSALLNFSQPDESAKEKCDLNQMVQQAKRSVWMRFNEQYDSNITINESYDNLPEQYFYRVNIIQALENIILNALNVVDLLEGQILIETGVQQHASESGKTSERIYCKIENDGPEIPEEDLDHILEPFFTKSAGGSGLGLSIAYQVITFNNGELDITSNPEKTSFIISFPV